MTHQADKAAARKIVGGVQPESVALCAAANIEDDFHSARGNSDFEDHTEEELEDIQESEHEEEEATESDHSAASSVPSSRASFRSQRSNTEHQDKKRLKKRLKATNSLHATIARKGIQDDTAGGRKGKVVLSMFRDSQKEGALEYTDWHGEVEEYIKNGFDNDKIKDAMFSSLEGKARQNFQHCDKRGDLTPMEILRKMDSSYNASVDFRDLNARLCGLKQGPFEMPKDYYDRMVDIGIALEEYHKDQFQPGELSRIEKECFFAGLREQSK